MLKLLLKKQLSEIFRNYFYDPKKNKMRSKAAVISYFVLFALLILGLVGGIFTYLAVSLCGALCDADMPWLYFLIMGLTSVMLGTFGCVFNTYAGLYLAKDNDLLLSLPIPVRYILFSRLLTVYLLGFLYSAVVSIPTCVVYWIVRNSGTAAIFGGILFVLLISLFILTLSCVLGWIVAKITGKLKNKGITTAFASLAFFGAYYFFYFKAKDLIADLLQNVAEYGNALYSKAYPLYLFGTVGTGDPIAAATVSAFVLVVLALVLYLIARSFARTITAAENAEKHAYDRRAVRQKSTFCALMMRELHHFSSNPTYMINCGFGILLFPLCGIALLWKGKTVFPVLSEVFGQNSDGILILAGTAVCILCTMNSMSEPSVSLEGNTLWIIRSLPIPSALALQCKVLLHVLMTAVPCLFCLVCLFIAYPVSPLYVFLITLLALSFIVLSAQIGLYIGLKMPILNWTSVITPIKQNVGVLLEILLGWVYCALFAVLFFLLDFGNIGAAPYMAVFCAVNVALCAFLYQQLNKKGCAVFESL